MYTAIIVIHVIICVALICIVLLQTGKGASLGAAFGGATQTILELLEEQDFLKS